MGFLRLFPLFSGLPHRPKYEEPHEAENRRVKPGVMVNVSALHVLFILAIDIPSWE